MTTTTTTTTAMVLQIQTVSASNQRAVTACNSSGQIFTAESVLADVAVGFGGGAFVVDIVLVEIVEAV